jgi:diacylglycerol kinase
MTDWIWHLLKFEGCQGFVGPVPPPFFISFLSNNERGTKLRGKIRKSKCFYTFTRKMKRFINSVGFALNGIRILLKNERHFKIHFLAFIFVLILGVFLNINRIEWLVLFITSALVMTIEAINTALEKLCDHVTPNQHESIKKVKDIAAGAVFIAVLFALVIGCVIFIPAFYKLC